MQVSREENRELHCSDVVIDTELQPNGEITSSNEEEPKLAKSFPWLTEFVNMCRADIGVTNITTLENLMTVYLGHVRSSLAECYVKPNRAAKLKRCMNDTLVLFHMLYCDIKKPLGHSSYLDKMSDLLAYYIDMEINASRRDHTIDHILDAILKTRNMTKKFCELCTYIFKRVLKEGPGRAVYEMTYVRYILVFKMWKRVVKGVEERRKVMKLATTKLSPPSQFREKLKSGLLCGVLPKIPKSRGDITMFLMQAKFCVKDKSKAFLKVVADPKQQCALGPSLSADLDRLLFFADGGDSPHNSNSDDQEDTSGSSMLMNDIWSSMSEAGLRDHLRLSSVTVTKPKNNAKSKQKKKVKDSLLKTEGNVTAKEVDKTKNKNKNKLKKMGCKSVEESRCTNENSEKTCAQEVKPPVLSSSEVSESCSQSVVEHGTKEACESTPLIPVENIKVEADSLDDVCFVGILRKGDEDLIINRDVGAEVRRDKDIEMLHVAREMEVRNDSQSSSVKLERPGTDVTLPPPISLHPHDILLCDQQPSTEWSPTPTQNYFNNALCDFINGYLSDFDLDPANTDLDHRDIYDMLDMGKSLQSNHKEIFPINSDNVLDQLPLEDDIRNNVVDVSNSPESESCPEAAVGKVKLVSGTEDEQHSTSVHQNDNQEKIDELIESFKEQGRYLEKTAETNVSNNTISVISEVETKTKEKDLLHYITLTSDHSVFFSQQQFRSLYVTEVLPPSIPVPSPSKMDSSSRCDCDQCTSNYEVLLTDYKKLAAYKNSKMNSASALIKFQEDEVGKGSEYSESVKNPRNEQHSSLPLKKRKTIHPSTHLKREATETSYPCTPMMSIAVALEKSRGGKAGEMQPLTTVVPTVNYNIPHRAQQYSYSNMLPTTSPAQPYIANASTGYNDVTVQGQTQHKYVPDKLVSNSYTTAATTNLTNTVQSFSFQRTFKTPAQLKQGISMPSVDLNATQDLINFARNTHNYYSQSQSSEGKLSKKTRRRARFLRSSKKKKI